MFFIPRKKGESVVFGDDIIVTVIEIRGDKVWLRLSTRRKSQFTSGKCTRRYSVRRRAVRARSRCLLRNPGVERVGSNDAPAKVIQLAQPVRVRSMPKHSLHPRLAR